MLKNRQKWRLLKDGIEDPFMHFAVEDAVLRLVDDGSSPHTLRIRQTIPSVWIGIYQNPEEDVDVKYCIKHNIPIVRRPNPGGAVYQDKGSFCYSAFFRREELFTHLGIIDPSDLYKIAGEAVIAVCRDFGVNAEPSPVNDITANNRKIYGSAQLELFSAFAHSGTFLVNTDIKTMQNCLKPSDLKFKEKGFKSVEERVINLSEAAGGIISVKNVIKSMTNHLADVFNVDLLPSPLTEQEKSLAEKLYNSKYSKKEWTFKDKQLYTTLMSTKNQSGIVNLHLNTDGEYIKNIDITGDFLLPDPDMMKKLILRVTNKSIKKSINFIRASGLPRGLKLSICNMIEKGIKGYQNNE